MEQLLRSIYYDPKAGFTSGRELYRRAKAQNPLVTYAKVDEFLSKQRVQQLHQTRHVEKAVGRITARHKDERWQADLVDMSAEPATHSRTTYKWLLIVVDIFTRRLFARPLPTKEVANVAGAFIEITNEAGVYPLQLTTDKGSEFLKTFDTKIGELDHHRVNVGDHRALGVVDATIKMFKSLLFRGITGGVNWVKSLQDLVHNFNNTPREALLGYTPLQAWENETLQGILNTYMNETEKPKEDEAPFKEGEKVSVPAQKGPFKRGFKQKFTEKKYPITKVLKHSVEVDVDGQKRRYLFSEVQQGGVALSQDVYEVEKVLPETRTIKRGKKTVKQKMVKFKGYDEPEWVDEGDIIV